jgi:hypothetical protein
MVSSAKKGEGFLDTEELNRGAETIVAKDPEPDNDSATSHDPFQDTQFHQSEDQASNTDSQESSNTKKPSSSVDHNPEKQSD